MHKQSLRKSSWLEDRHFNPDDPHEKRFDPLPNNGLPEVSSKVKRVISQVKMEKSDGRLLPITNLQKNELVQLKLNPAQDQNYDFDLEKISHFPLSKFSKFSSKPRFNNQGIFGDIFDEKKAFRFGSSIDKSIDMDKAYRAQLVLLKPRIRQQHEFKKDKDEIDRN